MSGFWDWIDNQLDNVSKRHLKAVTFGCYGGGNVKKAASHAVAWLVTSAYMFSALSLIIRKTHYDDCAYSKQDSSGNDVFLCDGSLVFFPGHSYPFKDNLWENAMFQAGGCVRLCIIYCS